MVIPPHKFVNLSVPKNLILIYLLPQDPLAGITALFLLNISISMAEPVMVSFIRVSDIVVSYILQVLVFKDTPSLQAVVGSSLVIMAVSMLSLENLATQKSPEKIKIFCDIMRKEI